MSDEIRAGGVRRSAVMLRHGEILRPVFTVEERLGDAIVVMRARRNEHLSLHRERDGSTLLTHWSPEKPPSIWDDSRVQIARRLGYRDPERHAHYYQHRPLYGPASGEDTEMLVGWRVRISAASARDKYLRMPSIELAAPAEDCMVTVVLRTSGDSGSEPGIMTAFGTLHFRFD